MAPLKVKSKAPKSKAKAAHLDDEAEQAEAQSDGSSELEVTDEAANAVRAKLNAKRKASWVKKSGGAAQSPIYTVDNESQRPQANKQLKLTPEEMPRLFKTPALDKEPHDPYSNRCRHPNAIHRRAETADYLLDCIPQRFLQSVVQLRAFWAKSNVDPDAKGRVTTWFHGMAKQHCFTETWFSALFDPEPPNTTPSSIKLEGSQSLVSLNQASDTGKPAKEKQLQTTMKVLRTVFMDEISYTGSQEAKHAILHNALPFKQYIEKASLQMLNVQVPTAEIFKELHDATVVSMKHRRTEWNKANRELAKQGSGGRPKKGETLSWPYLLLLIAGETERM
eukprot:gene12835-48_t